jgi:hypothetical protein
MDEYESFSHSKWECKYHVVGYIKGKSAIHLARVWGREAELCGSSIFGA